MSDTSRRWRRRNSWRARSLACSMKSEPHPQPERLPRSVGDTSVRDAPARETSARDTSAGDIGAGAPRRTDPRTDSRGRARRAGPTRPRSANVDREMLGAMSPRPQPAHRRRRRKRGHRFFAAVATLAVLGVAIALGDRYGPAVADAIRDGTANSGALASSSATGTSTGPMIAT